MSLFHEFTTCIYQAFYRISHRNGLFKEQNTMRILVWKNDLKNWMIEEATVNGSL